MKRNVQRFLLAFLLITCFVQGYAETDINIEQLKDLKEKGMISEEDYNIIFSEINGTLENEQLYDLNVNGALIDNRFKSIIKGDTMYLPLFRFIETLGFFNLTQTQEEAILSLNNELVISIDKISNKLSVLTNKALSRKISYEKDYLIKENGDYYLRADLFQEIFLSSLVAEKNNSTIRMRLGFNTPEEMAILFSLKQEEVKKAIESNEVIYVNTPKMFELGNARIELYQYFNKEAGNKSYDTDWEGSLEYQGALLYGNLTTSYNLKEKTIGDVEIEYENIIEDHNLKIGAYSVGEKSRELGFSLRKDKGYYELGKKIIIDEDVPIGSRVELLYMGYPIEVQDAENGRVVFNNNQIRSNRNYQLKIYLPSGDVETRFINTVQDYNQQNKGEIEYDVLVREDHDSKRYKWDTNVYYGFTDNLTVGIGHKRSPEEVKEEYKFLDEARIELTYSNQQTGTSYPTTIRIGTDQTLTKGEDNNDQRYDERFKYDALVEVRTNDWLVKTELEKHGPFYTEEYINRNKIEYNAFNNLTLAYEYELRKLRSGGTSDENIFTAYFDKGLTSNLLFSSEIKISDKGAEEYRADFFYNGFKSFNINWKNTWSEKASNYETELELYSNDFYGMLDYSLGLKYSERHKERLTFNFTIDYDNFLKITGRAGEKGSRELKAGIDKVVDLKSITTPLDDIDATRVKVVSFVDSNDNNIYDDGEVKVDNVEVKIGTQTQITDEFGEAMFYGIPNKVLLNLNPTIRKPSYSLGNNIIKVRGTATSTIEAYLPIKPMLTLIGTVNVDKSLNLSLEQLQEIYSNLLISIKNLKGEELEVSMPDESGSFIISNIFPEEYIFDIKYIGNKLNLLNQKQNLKLSFTDSSSIEVVLNLSDKSISIDQVIENEL